MTKREFFEKIGIIPKFNEVKFFLTSLVFLLIFGTNNAIRHKYLSDIIAKDAEIVLILIFLAIGISFYHAFFSKKISGISKVIMLLFVLILNVFISAETYRYITDYKSGPYLILPIINIFNAFLMIFLFKTNLNLMLEISIEDTQAKYQEIIISSFIALFIFFISQYVWKHYWAISFSLCLIYTYNISEFINHLFYKIKNKYGKSNPIY